MAATKPFYHQLKWLFCAAIKGMPTPTEPLVNKNVLKGVPRQWNPHSVETLEMLWDVKYSSPPTKRTYLFLRSEALHHSATQLLQNLQLLGADVGIYLTTDSAFNPSKQNPRYSLSCPTSAAFCPRLETDKYFK